jgi:tetratricopeptide (TPR) repeat protein
MKNMAKYLIFIALVNSSFSCSSGKDKALDSYIKGKEAYSKKELSKAREHFLRAIDLDKNLFNAKLMLAKIHYYQKDYKKSLEYADSILKSEPNHVGALYWKAKTVTIQAKGKNGDTEAIQCLLQALELDSHHILARSLLALLYEKNEKYTEAVYEYKVLLEEEESLINARTNLGILYKRLGLKSKSIEEINTAINISKSSGFDNSNLKQIKREIEQ